MCVCLLHEYIARENCLFENTNKDTNYLLYNIYCLIGSFFGPTGSSNLLQKHIKKNYIHTVTNFIKNALLARIMSKKNKKSNNAPTSLTLISPNEFLC